MSSSSRESRISRSRLPSGLVDQFCLPQVKPKLTPIRLRWATIAASRAAWVSPARILEAEPLGVFEDFQRFGFPVAQDVGHFLFVVQHGEEVFGLLQRGGGRPAADDLGEAAQVVAGRVPGENVAGEHVAAVVARGRPSSTGFWMIRSSRSSMMVGSFFNRGSRDRRRPGRPQ